MGFQGWTTVLITAAGCLLAALALHAGGVTGWRRVRYALGLGPGLGLGVVSLVFFFGRVIGLGQPGLIELLIVFAGLSAVAVAWSRRRTRVEPDVVVPGARAPVALRAAALLALLIGIGSAVESYRVLSRSWSEGTWDAVAIWNVRARFLERGYEDISTLFKQVERSSHPHYPLLLPGAVATQLVIAGEDDAWVPETTGLAFLLGLGLLTFAIVADSGLLSYAALATAMLWGTPILLKWGGAQCGDIPTAYFFLGAVAALASNLPGRAAGDRLPPIPSVLGGVFLGLLAWTKNEGTLMTLLLLGLFAVWMLASGEGGLRGWREWKDWKRWRPLIGFGLGAAPGMAAVFLFKRLWAPESGLDTFLGGELIGRILSLERWWLPVQEILKRLLPLKETYGWGLAWPALELGVVLAIWLHWRARRPWTSFWGAAILVTILSWIPIYVVTPYAQLWHISGSLDRLFLQIFPAVIAGVFLRVAVAAAATDHDMADEPAEVEEEIVSPSLRSRFRLPAVPDRVFLAALLGVALIVKAATVLRAVPSIWLMADELLYTLTAWDFAHWGALGVPHPGFLYYPPLVSLVIAPLHRLGLTPPHVYTLTLILFNALLTSTVLAAYLILRRLYGATSRLLPVLLAFAAPCTALVLMSEPLYITLFLWFLYFYVRMLQDRKASDHLVAGLLLAGMILTRQVGALVLAAVIAGAVADLVLEGTSERRRKLGLYAWAILPPVLVALAWRWIAPGLKGGGGSNLPYFLAVAVTTPVKLVFGSARRLVSEIGYVSLSTFGIALPAVLWGLFRRGSSAEEDRRRLFTGVVLFSMVLTAAVSGVFMWFARFRYLPRYDMYGRYIDYFGIPVLALALGVYWQMRRDASKEERWRLAAWTLVLNAALLLVIPGRFFPGSLQAQIAPNALALTWLLELVRIFGPGIRWLLPPAAALLALLLASPSYLTRRGVRYGVIAGLAALTLFNYWKGAVEVSIQSHGSLQYASSISDYIRDNPEPFANGLYVDHPGIGYKRTEAPEMAAQHAFLYRVLADHMDKAIAGSEPERFHARMPVLSMRPFPGWRVLAEWPWVQYKIYAPAEAGGG